MNLNVKTQHAIKSDFDIYVKDILIRFSYLKNIFKIFSSSLNFKQN